ncbi:RNA recognition motif-containing protein [Gonapodya sp. JEL0774]|nr:RNA recognition motif-containing protein [Gonapodya sp. JEL0774]
MGKKKEPKNEIVKAAGSGNASEAQNRRTDGDDSDAESFDFEMMGPAVKTEESVKLDEDGDIKMEETDEIANSGSSAAERAPKLSRTTLFVRNIPFDATSQELAEFFSEIGPTRNCFVVGLKPTMELDGPGREQVVPNATSNAPNRGIGFVQFALAEDAQKALETLKDVKFRGLRKLKLEFAQARHGVKDGEGTPAKPPVVPKPTQKAKGAKSSKSLPTNLIVSNLSEIPGLTKNHLRKKLRKFGELTDLEFPILGWQSRDAARATYPTWDAADSAAKRLDGHVFKGVVVKAVVEERRETGNRGKGREARLIVRNLPFTVNDAKLRSLFSDFGTLKDVKLPLKAPTSENSLGTPRGFGFVEFESRKEAEAAIEKVNGTTVGGRIVAVDWAVSKRVWEEEVKPGGEDEITETKTEDDDDGDDNPMRFQNESEGDLKDELDDDADVKLEDDDDEDHKDGDDSSVWEEDDWKDEESSSHVEDTTEVADSPKGLKRKHSVSIDNGDATVKLSPEEERERMLKKRKAEAETTVFVKNLAFETGEEDLAEKFRHFGPIRYARITQDLQTGRSRGTAFVRFVRSLDCQRCLTEYAAAAATMSFEVEGVKKAQESDSRKKGPPKPPSVLNPEPSTTASSTPFFLHGRSLVVLPAVTRVQAGALVVENKRKKRGQDKRNLYLAREGVVFPDTPAAASMTPTEVSKRQTSYAERKRMLERNPNLFVSKTRLSLRNLWTQLHDGDLRKLSKLAVDAFWREWRQGTRQGLEREVLEEDGLLDPIAVGDYEHDDPSRKVPDIDPSTVRYSKPVIKQAKVIRDTVRLDPATGLGRSKGYGFVEFSRHADALACLRWLNNNPQAYASVAPEVAARNKAIDEKGQQQFTKAAVKKKAKKDAEGNTPGAEATDSAATDRVSYPTKRPIVEFSIENSLVVQKREERVKNSLAGSKAKEKEASEASSSGAPPVVVRKKGRKKMSLLERIKEKKLRKKLEGAVAVGAGKVVSAGANGNRGPLLRKGEKIGQSVGNGSSKKPVAGKGSEAASRQNKRKRDGDGDTKDIEKRRKTDGKFSLESTSPGRVGGPAKPAPRRSGDGGPSKTTPAPKPKQTQPRPKSIPTSIPSSVPVAEPKKKKERSRPGLSKEQKRDLQEDREFDTLVAKYRKNLLSEVTGSDMAKWA